MTALQTGLEKLKTDLIPEHNILKLTIAAALRFAVPEVLQTKSLLPEIPLSEVAEHDSFNDCWIVIYDRVYNVTSFLKTHPGGYDVMLEYAGHDATLPFRGTGHSETAFDQLKAFLIGELPDREKMYRCTNGLTLSDIPD